MAIYLTQEPDKWDSAGRPIEAKFVSTRFPNQLPGESALPIFEIKNPTAFELANVPGLDADDVRVDGDWSLANFVAGDIVTITGTANGFYPDGNYKVLKSLSINIITIEVAYNGDDTFGTLSRYYNNYVLYADGLVTNALPRTQPYPLQLSPSNDFIINISEQLQRTFPSPFVEVYPGMGYNGLPASMKSVVQGYGVTVGEAYDVPTNGIPEFYNPGPAFKLVSNKYAINSAHPYHETDADGNVLFNWMSDYKDYLMDNASPGGEKKFLTWGSRTDQTIGPDEDFFLVYLWEGNRNDGLELKVIQYDAAGNNLGSVNLPMIAQELHGAYVINVGTKSFTGINETCAKYSFALQNQNEGLISEVWTLNVRQRCDKAPTRFYWRNGLGGVDQYTFTDRSDEIISSENATITKPYMQRNFSSYVEWNERAYKSKNKRGGEVFSEPMKWADHRWLSRELLESADIVTCIDASFWTKVIRERVDGKSFSSKGGAERMSIRYRLGVDQTKQQQ